MNSPRSLLAAACLSVGLIDPIARPIGPDCWSPLPAPLSPHRYNNVVEVGGRAYAIGGDAKASFEVYEPPAAAWRELPPMPTPRAFAAAVSIGTRIYVLGGVNQSRVSLAVMEEFDVVSGKWRRRADLTTPRNRFAAVAAGGRIFALGGLAETGNLSVTEIYDPVNDRWRPGPELPRGEESPR